MNIREIIDHAISARDYDQQLHWVCQLMKNNPDEVMKELYALYDAADENPRLVAAWTMGELGYPEKPLADERLELLDRMLQKETSPSVRERILHSIGLVKTSASETLLIRLEQSIMPSDRLAWIQSLVNTDSSRTVDILLHLSKDADPRIRDWAFFGLGQQHDTAIDNRDRIIATLRKGVEDVDDAAKCEAYRALLMFRDLSCARAFIAYLESREIHRGIIDVVEEMVLMCEETTNSQPSN